LILLGIGLVAGGFGGLLGVGGGIITLPAMALILGRNHPPEYQHVYQAAAMIVTIFITAPSARWHYRQKAVTGQIVKWTIPSALVSILVGVKASNLSMFSGQGALYLRQILGVFLLYVLGYNLYRLAAGYRLPEPSVEQLNQLGAIKPIAMVGAPMGFLGGLLGIGGGSLCVPLQQVFLRIPLRHAIANSTVTMLSVGIFGAAYKMLTLPMGSEAVKYALHITAALTPTCFIGGYVGSKLTYILPRDIVRLVFSLLMLYAGVKLLIS